MQTRLTPLFSFVFLLAMGTMHTADAQSLPIRDPFISEKPELSQKPTDGREASQGVNIPDLAPMKSKQPSPMGDDLIGIIVGSRPYALVNQSGKPQLVSIGDTFQGHKIVRITLERITFDNASSADIAQVHH